MSTEETSGTENTENESTTEVTDWKAEAEKWKTLADQTDKRAKRLSDEAKTNSAAAKKLQELEQQSMTDIEKARLAGEADGAAKTRGEFAIKLVEAQFRVAAVGRSVDVVELLDGINAARFLDANGDPDVPKITKYMDAISPIADDTGQRPRVPAGVRDTSSTKADPTKEFADLIKSQLNR